MNLFINFFLWKKLKSIPPPAKYLSQLSAVLCLNKKNNHCLKLMFSLQAVKTWRNINFLVL